MSVNGSQVAEAHFLEDQAAAVAAAAVGILAGGFCAQGDLGKGAFEGLLRLVAELEGQFAFGHAFDQALHVLLQLVIARMGDELVEIGGNGADVFGDAPFVVVENADEAAGGVGEVIEGLEGNAVGQRGVAKNADDVFIRAALIARGAHAQRGGKGGAGVARAVAIVLAFGAQGETVQAAGGADGVKTVLAAGEQFVDVALMADVPDEFVVRRGEDVVEGDGQFDDAEVGAEVAAVFGQLGDQFVADFPGQLFQLIERQFFDVRGMIDHVQIAAHAGCCVELRGFEAQFAFGVLLQLLDFDLGLVELGLAELGQGGSLPRNGPAAFPRANPALPSTRQWLRAV